MIEEVRLLETDEEIKIGFNPYKLRIMWIYTRNPESMTAKQVADEMGEPPSKVHYHIQILVKHNFLKLIKTKNINGIIAKYYQRVYKSFRMSPKVTDNPIFKEYYDNDQIRTYDLEYRTYREKLIYYFDNYFESGKSPNHEYGTIFPTLYMTQKEAQDLSNKIIKLVQKHTVKDDEKDEYKSFLGTVLCNKKEE
ncbi:MAG: hypothetical protein KQ78_01380 [Candidatus Izimaplasma bacterium HR2]|nr:MAG: hypothetical protein KQ78_01380 [Candidatus Izimaplasma bacterium HR2]